jgi:hypothetical protein
MPNPLADGTSYETQRRAIHQVATGLHKRIEPLMALPTCTRERMSLQDHLDEIGDAA